MFEKNPWAVGRKTIEYWSGKRRLLYNPASTKHSYIALSMPHDDRRGKGPAAEEGRMEEVAPAPVAIRN